MTHAETRSGLRRIRDGTRSVLVGWAALLSMLPGCAYHHPVAPRGADLAERSEGVLRNVEVGSLVRLETSSGQKMSGEVLSLDDEVLVLRLEGQGGEQTRVVELRNIEDLTVKTWRKADTIFFTTLGLCFVFLTVAAVSLAGLSGLGES